MKSAFAFQTTSTCAKLTPPMRSKSLSRLLPLTAAGLLAVGCGGRIAADPDAPAISDADVADVAMDHDTDGHGESGGGVADVSDALDADGAPPWDGSIERCLGKGNFAYAAYTFDGKPGEATIAGAPWRLNVELPHWLDLSAIPSTDHAGYFEFESPSTSEPLVPGSYADAVLPPPETGHPGLRAHFVDAASCSDMKGSFVIHTLEWNGETKPEKRRLKRLSATFETNCYLLTLKGCLNFEQ